ncbi:MAG: SHD1 domain-containing protein, partial [Planctomycetia bacterium]|nr:SHD1 domain-containing protein [Planctomycetia bacterium]
MSGRTLVVTVVSTVLLTGWIFFVQTVKGDTGNAASSQESTTEYRVWKDKSERFSVEAVLVEQDSQRVKLKRKDGRTLSLPIARLSQKDQDFLKEQSENPFAIAEKEEASKASSTAASPSAPAASQETAKTESTAKGAVDPARLYEIEELKQSFVTGDRSSEKSLVSGGNSV